MDHPHESTAVTRLPALLLNLHRARSALADERGVQQQPHAALGARNALLDALQDYIDGLESACRPVPYRLRDELRLRQALRGSPYIN